MRVSARHRRQQTRLVLTDRDRRILAIVERFRLVTREQLQRFIGWECTSKINARLRRLFDAGFLDRRFLPVRYGMAPAIYLLGPESTAEMARATGANAEKLTQNRYENKSSSDGLLSHMLALNDFASFMCAQLRQAGDAEWLEWLNERDLIVKCNIPGAIEGSELKPDGLLKYRIGNNKFNAFLELDTGTEPVKRLQKKLDTYWEFKDSGKYTAAFQQRGFRVLFITLSPGRAKSLAERLQIPGDLKIYICALSSNASADIDILFGSKWQQPGADGLMTLHPRSLIKRETSP